MRWAAAALTSATGLVVAAGCGGGPAGPVAASTAPPPSGTPAAATAGTPSGATRPGPATTPTASPPPTSRASPPATSPPFTAAVERVTATDLGASWHPGCPTPPSRLRAVRLRYWGFDHRWHTGTLVVAAVAVTPVVDAFRALYDERFPIRRMVPVSRYGGSDDASMAADNTSAFNCRDAVSTGAAHWSEHAYGLAVDVNPVENPYLLAGRVLPPAGTAYADRARARPGMAERNGPLVAAFARVGWGWGGHWEHSKDFQHFSANGR